MSTQPPYTAPDLSLAAFNCPHCFAFADQAKSHVTFFAFGTKLVPDRFVTTTCNRCKKFAVWIDQGMIYPGASTAPQPNADLPEDIKKDYQEARNILAYSPRGAAALLRLALQKLCAALGESGNNINEDIKSLVRKGLMPMVQ